MVAGASGVQNFSPDGGGVFGFPERREIVVECTEIADGLFPEFTGIDISFRHQNARRSSGLTGKVIRMILKNIQCCLPQNNIFGMKPFR